MSANSTFSPILIPPNTENEPGHRLASSHNRGPIHYTERFSSSFAIARSIRRDRSIREPSSLKKKSIRRSGRRSPEKRSSVLVGNYEGFRQALAVSSVSVVPDNNARIGEPCRMNSNPRLPPCCRICPSGLMQIWVPELLVLLSIQRTRGPKRNWIVLK